MKSTLREYKSPRKQSPSFVTVTSTSLYWTDSNEARTWSSLSP